VKNSFNDELEKLRDIFVSIDVFNLRISPIEKIVYGGAGLILISVVTAIIYTVLKQQ
jgi:hypothetical protein